MVYSFVSSKALSGTCICLTYLILFQVAVLDWVKEIGLKTENEFVEIFGDNSIHFFECDVSRKIDLESESYINLALLPYYYKNIKQYYRDLILRLDFLQNRGFGYTQSMQ